MTYNIDLNDLFPTTLGNLDLSSQTLTTGLSTNYSINTGINYSYNWSNITQPALTADYGTIKANAALEINGENADIRVNGKSLTAAIAKIEERLAILKPNVELENEWEELKNLGDQYRKLEKELQEKMRVWETLKKEF